MPYKRLDHGRLEVPLWTNRYHGPGLGDDSAFAVFVDSTGNVFVTGISRITSYSYQAATIKYSAAGAPLWTNRLKRVREHLRGGCGGRP
jgi:hypothetical protein